MPPKAQKSGAKSGKTNKGAGAPVPNASKRARRKGEPADSSSDSSGEENSDHESDSSDEDQARFS